MCLQLMAGAPEICRPTPSDGVALRMPLTWSANGICPFHVYSSLALPIQKWDLPLSENFLFHKKIKTNQDGVAAGDNFVRVVFYLVI